jgi:hypothetical protein
MDRLLIIKIAADKLMDLRVSNENILKLINRELARFD